MYGHLKCFATSRHATRFERRENDRVHHLVVPSPAVEGRDFAHERVRAHVVPRVRAPSCAFNPNCCRILNASAWWCTSIRFPDGTAAYVHTEQAALDTGYWLRLLATHAGSSRSSPQQLRKVGANGILCSGLPPHMAQRSQRTFLVRLAGSHRAQQARSCRRPVAAAQ